MKIEQEFVVGTSIDDVWAFFQDVPQVAQCLPGADLASDLGNGEYEGSVESKLGPMTAKFDGKARVTADAGTRAGHIEGQGTDKRGGSRGKVSLDYRLTEVDEGTRVEIDADLTLSGAAAQFGRTGLIKEMSGRLINEFVNCAEGKLQSASPEDASQIRAGDVRGISLFLNSLWATIVDFFKRLFGSG